MPVICPRRSGFAAADGTFNASWPRGTRLEGIEWIDIHAAASLLDRALGSNTLAASPTECSTVAAVPEGQVAA